MFLLDTVVISELRKPGADPAVLGWIGVVPAIDVFVSSVTFGEIEVGIEKQRSRNPAFAAELETWVRDTVRAYGDRILPFGVAEARRWGTLAARVGNKGMDLAIAATALEHGLTVATRNVAHFAPTGVAIFDPFTGKAYPPS
jgi:predicted nucleic acid-binding protein